MNVNTLSALFYIGIAVCALGVLSAVAMFFLFDIPTVFAQVTGLGAKMMSEKMHKQYDDANASNRPVTEEVIYTNELIAGKTAENGSKAEETNVLNPLKSATTSSGSQSTTLLGASQQVTTQSAPKVYAPAGKFELFENVVWIHTDEII